MISGFLQIAPEKEIHITKSSLENGTLSLQRLDWGRQFSYMYFNGCYPGSYIA